MKDQLRDARKTIRLPSFLLNSITDKNNLPKCKSENDKYVYILELGLNAINEFERINSDPQYKQKAKDNLEKMLADGLMIEGLMDMKNNEPSKFKGLTMAVDLVRGRGK